MSKSLTLIALLSLNVTLPLMAMQEEFKTATPEARKHYAAIVAIKELFWQFTEKWEDEMGYERGEFLSSKSDFAESPNPHYRVTIQGLFIHIGGTSHPSELHTPWGGISFLNGGRCISLNSEITTEFLSLLEAELCEPKKRVEVNKGYSGLSTTLGPVYSVRKVGGIELPKAERAEGTPRILAEKMKHREPAGNYAVRESAWKKLEQKCLEGKE